MKKVLLKVLTFILALCCVGLVACDNKPQGPSASLVDFNDSTVSVKIGMNYTIAEYVYDTEGNRYALSASVTDVDGQKVEAEGFFQVNKASYKVVYSVDFAGENKTKTVTVKGISVPSIELENYQEQTYTLGILPAELPAINANDFIDGKITEVTKAVYQVTPYENVKMTDYDGKANFYTPKSIGTYYWEVTVTNSAGQTATRQLYFFVTSDPGEYNMPVYDGGENRFKCAKTLTYDYVTFSEIPTAGIDNGIGYNGPAYKIGNIPHNASITTTLGYTAKEYLALEAAGKFNAVQFYYMIDSTRHPSRTTCGNNDQRLPGAEHESFNGNWSIFSGAGYYAIRRDAESSTITKEGRYIPTNQWRCATVPVSEFVKTLGNGKTAEIITTFMFGSSDTVDMYLGAIEFITYDWTKVPYQGEYGIDIDENNYGKITITGQGATVEYLDNASFPETTTWWSTYKDAEGNTVKVPVLDADGNPVLDADGNPKYQNDLKEVTETVTNLYGYSGNAAKVEIPSNNKWVYATFNYTAQQYLALEKEGKFNAVKISLMTESGYNNVDYGVYAAAGYAKKSLPRAQWQTFVFTIEEFVSCFESMDSSKALIYRSYLTNSMGHNLYVGDFEFVTFDWENEALYADNYDIEPVAGALPMFDIHSTATAEIVTAEQFPTTDGAKVVTNPINYDGDAIKISIPSTAKGIRINMNYTGNQYRYIASQEGFNAVKITYLYTGGSATNPAGTLFAILGPVRDKWTTKVLTIDEFVASFGRMVKPEGASNYTAFEADATSKSLIIRTDAWCEPHQLYLGGIELTSYDFNHEHTGGTATCKELAVCDVCGNVYGELAPHVEDVEVEGQLPTGTTTGTSDKTSCTVCGEVLSEGGDVLPAMNFTASEANLEFVTDNRSKHVEKAFVANADIPTEGINNEVGFAGDAFKMGLNHNVAVKVTFPYSGNEYAKLAAKGAFNAVKVTYLVVPNEEIPSLRNSAAANNLFQQLGYKTQTSAGKKLAQNAWTTHVITADEFVTAFTDMDSKTIEFFRSFITVGATQTYDFYFATIEFFTYHEHVGGTATCTELAKCDICGEGYGEYAAHVGGTATCSELAVCDVCGQGYGEFAAHTKDSNNVATCQKLAKCKVCKQEYGELGTHVGGFATCSSLAKCNTCGQEYGQVGDHVAVYVVVTNPTATTAGLASGTKCAICDDALSSEQVEIPALNISANDATLENIVIHATSGITKEIVAAADIPTDYDNTIAFSGDMIKLNATSNARGAYITMPYTGAEVKAFAEAAGYNRVKFTYLWIPKTASDLASGTLVNANGEIVRNVYTEVELTIDQFVGSFGAAQRENSSASNKSIYKADINSNKLVIRADAYGTWTLYISGIEFINAHIHTGGTATCKDLAVCDVCGQPYGELGGHTEHVEIVGSLPTATTPGSTDKKSCLVCGEVFQEQQVLPAFNFVPYEEGTALVTDNASTKDYVVTYKANADIPTTDIANPVNYAGNAYKMESVPHNIKVIAELPYTAEELAKYAEAGLFNYVKVTYMLHSSAYEAAFKVFENGSEEDKTALTAAGYANKAAITCDSWVTETIYINAFLDAMNGNKIDIIKNFIAVGSTKKFDFYLGNIEFVKTTDIWSQGGLVGLGMLADKTTTTTITSGGVTGDPVVGNPVKGTTFTTQVSGIYTLTELPTQNLNLTDSKADNDERGVEITGTHTGNNASAIKNVSSRIFAYYAVLNYSADEIRAIAAANGYEKISITYLIDSVVASSASKWYWNADCPSALKLVGSKDSQKETANKWVTIEYTIEEFCALMGAVPTYTKTEDGKAVETTDEVTGDVTSTVTTTYSYWDAEVQGITSNYLLLAQGYKTSTFDLYLSGISFVAPAQA